MLSKLIIPCFKNIKLEVEYHLLLRSEKRNTCILLVTKAIFSNC